MSGGSYDYVYTKIEDFGHSIRQVGQCSCASPMLRRAFAKHVLDVANAAKAIEWNDSCDGDDEETKLILKCLGKSAELNECISEAKEIILTLEKLLKVKNTDEKNNSKKNLQTK